MCSKLFLRVSSSLKELLRYVASAQAFFLKGALRQRQHTIYVQDQRPVETNADPFLSFSSIYTCAAHHLLYNCLYMIGVLDIVQVPAQVMTRPAARGGPLTMTRHHPVHQDLTTTTSHKLRINPVSHPPPNPGQYLSQ